MLTVRVDPREVLGMLDAAVDKQLPFAVAKALNATANAAQASMREHIRGDFHLRREPWVLRQIYISKEGRATKTSWFVVIQAREDAFKALTRLESGADHIPHGKWLWRPNSEVFGDRVISRKDPLHPSSIAFNNRMQAANGIFLVRGKGGPLVLQRLSKNAKGITQSIARGGRRGPRGRGLDGRYTHGAAIGGVRRGGVRLLYKLVSRSKTPGKLAFFSTTRQSVAAHWPEEMARALDTALRTAR